MPPVCKTRVECYAYDVGVSEILQFMFYCSAVQEAIRFNIGSPLVAHDLTKNLEEFNWESFELWLDIINVSLIGSQSRESGIGASFGDEKVKSSESSLFPLPYP